MIEEKPLLGKEKIYLKALNTYYKLKNQYDENHEKDIHKIIRGRGLKVLYQNTIQNENT